MNDTAHLRSSLPRAVDLIHGFEDMEVGIIGALRLFQAATDSDLWLLMRRRNGSVCSVITGMQELDRLEWPDTDGFLAQAQWIMDLSTTPLFKVLPDNLRGQRSMISVPVNIAGDEPMVLMLLSREKGAFARSDQKLLEQTGRLIEKAAQNRRHAQPAPALASLFGTGRTKDIGASAGPEISYQELSSAYVRLVEWQQAILEITNTLLCTSLEETEVTINRALADAGALAASDRTYVFRLRDHDRIDNTHEWTGPGIEPMIAHLQDMPASLMDEWRDDMAAGRAVHIPDVAALPDTSTLREVLMMQSIRSLLAVPMLRDGNIVGFVGFDAVRSYRRFLPLEIQLLQSVANAANVVLDRCAAEAATETALIHLEAERSRLDTTLSAIPDLVLELDRDGRFSAHGAGSGLRTAIPPAEFIGRLPEEILPPELAKLTHDVMQLIDREGHVTGLEYEFDIDGEPRWYSLSAAAKFERGQHCGYVFVIRDVTGQLIQRRRLQRLSKIAELTSNVVIITDTEQRIEWVNPAFELRTGWRLDDIIGKRPDSFLASEKTDSAELQRIGAALREGKAVRAELLNQTRDGEEYWISKDIQPLFGTDGRVEGFVAVQTDITAIKLSHEKALHDRAVALDASGDGIAIVDADGYYVYMNAAHRRLLGISDEADISELHWSKIYTEETVQRFMAKELQKLQANGRWRGQLHGRHSDGSLVPQEVSLTLHDGRILCLTRDITEQLQQSAEQARMREELQLAQRRETIAHLASGVAHDLNNLVAVVAGSVSLLAQKVADDEEARASVDRIRRATETARDLVRGLGHLGRPQVVRGKHDLRDLVAEGIELLGSRRIRDQELCISQPDVPCHVWANGTELLQVIVNLGLNACDSSCELPNPVRFEIKEGGRLPDRSPDAGVLRRDTAHSIFIVADNGAGIDADIRANLFERYFTTKGDQGTGLGLPIVAGILRENRAALWIDSIPGSGTTVTVAWPSERPESLPHDPGSSAHCASQVNLTGCNILVVDDVQDVADVFSEFLEACGATAVAVTDPVEAAALLQDNPSIWAALVTDLDMPALNGSALARIAATCNPPIPAVLVTALPQTIGVEAELFSAVLPKPISPEKLTSAVYIATQGAIAQTHSSGLGRVADDRLP
ncbi:hybrid sensor histidine kinase/response regulator [Roseinatronobacter sp. NSM]|uniref:hybrid sensor histidine kinase/response regulator n=1 Tax=Roseinatronobacter sp. NSM TaxID=3457785 RepID=UPI004035FF40